MQLRLIVAYVLDQQRLSLPVFWLIGLTNIHIEMKLFAAFVEDFGQRHRSVSVRKLNLIIFRFLFHPLTRMVNGRFTTISH